MNNGSLGRRTATAGVLVISAALALSACGGSKKDTGTTGKDVGDIFSAIKQDPQLHDQLGPAVKSSGKIVVATDPSYAPNEFYGNDNKTLVGMDLDLGKALGKKLGIDFSFQKASFDGIIPGLQSGQYQAAMSSITDNKEREKTVDFVTYFTAGTALMVKKGNPGAYKPDDLSLCGKKVAVEKGTVQLDEVSATVDAAKGTGARTKKCKDGGKPGPTGQAFPDQNGANLALSSGRADAVLADSPVIEYAVKQSNGQFETAGATYDTAPYGIALSKQLGTTKEAVLGALKALQADGTYKKILEKWGIEAGALGTPGINGAQS